MQVILSTSSLLLCRELEVRLNRPPWQVSGSVLQMEIQDMILKTEEREMHFCLFQVESQETGAADGQVQASGYGLRPHVKQPIFI